MSGEAETTPMGTPIAAAECPHCNGLIYVVLRKGAPIALPADPRVTALLPKPTARSAETVKIEKPPAKPRESWLD